MYYIGLAGQNVPPTADHSALPSGRSGILVVSFEDISPERRPAKGDIIVGLENHPSPISTPHKLLTEERIGRKRVSSLIGAPKTGLM